MGAPLSYSFPLPPRVAGKHLARWPAAMIPKGDKKKIAIRFLFARMRVWLSTRRQKEVIGLSLSGFTQKHGYSPSYEEIAHGLGLNSLATVHKHVTNLQNKGLLQRAHKPQPLHRCAAAALHQTRRGPPSAAGPHCRGQAGGSHRDRREHLAQRHHRQSRGLRAGSARRLHAR